MVHKILAEKKKKKTLLLTKNTCFESVSEMWWVKKKKIGWSEPLAVLIPGSTRSQTSKNVVGLWVDPPVSKVKGPAGKI